MNGVYQCHACPCGTKCTNWDVNRLTCLRLSHFPMHDTVIFEYRIFLRNIGVGCEFTIDIVKHQFCQCAHSTFRCPFHTPPMLNVLTEQIISVHGSEGISSQPFIYVNVIILEQQLQVKARQRNSHRLNCIAHILVGTIETAVP